jgi:hypothetical protein
MWVEGLGFIGFRVCGLGFTVKASGLWILGLRFRVEGPGNRV